MKRILAALAVTTTLATGLVACGGDDSTSSSSEYCGQLKKAKTVFDALDKQDVSKFDDALKTVSDFADSAPDRVRGDWKTLDDALGELKKALAEAGVKLSDLATIQQGKLPAGVDASKLADLGTKVQKIGSDETQKASDAIQKDAKDACKVDLSS